MADAKELQVREKQEVNSPAELTRPGRVFTPSVDIFETEKEITVLADMPGVESGGLNIDLRDDILTISGDVKPMEAEDETDVLVEFEVGKYFRQFSLSESIDQAKIEAKLADGVLHLVMPKAEKAVPRKISVSVG